MKKHGENQKYYGKLKKHQKRYILHDLTYMWSLKIGNIVKLIVSKNGMVITRVWGAEEKRRV